MVHERVDDESDAEDKEHNPDRDRAVAGENANYPALNAFSPRGASRRQSEDRQQRPKRHCAVDDYDEWPYRRSWMQR